MNLYLISQHFNIGYDTYDSAVVVANTEEEARNMHPRGAAYDRMYDDYVWASPEHVVVKWLGIAAQFDAPEVVCASFNAG